jgi:hypothetical protein
MPDQPLHENSSAALMWMGGHYGSLFDPTYRWLDVELDGVRELMELADSYVLNEFTLIAGSGRRDPDPIESFFQNDSAITLVPEKDVDRFREGLGVLGLSEQLRSDDARYETESRLLNDPIAQSDLSNRYREPRLAKFNEVNTREALAYLYYADSENAAYIPERQFGFAAIERYGKALPSGPWGTTAFRSAIAARFGDSNQMPLTQHLVPSFLLEALRSASRPDGILATLRDLRSSDAATHYRTAVQVLADPATPTRRRADLAEELKLAATREGLQPRVPRALKLTVALSSLALGLIFPAVKPFAPAGAAAIQLAEIVDVWMRRRTNIFWRYEAGSYEDLFVELKRIFPHIRFTDQQLAFFLDNLNFGWPREWNE